MNNLNCKQWKGWKKLTSVTIRWKFSNLKTPISTVYCPTCFLWIVGQFLYAAYESYILLTVKRVKKINKALPKDENFRILMHQFPLSTGQSVSLLNFEQFSYIK